MNISIAALLCFISEGRGGFSASRCSLSRLAIGSGRPRKSGRCPCGERKTHAAYVPITLLYHSAIRRTGRWALPADDGLTTFGPQSKHVACLSMPALSKSLIAVAIGLGSTGDRCH